MGAAARKKYFSSATKMGTIVPEMVAIAAADPGTVLFGSVRQSILALMFLRPDESFYLREIVRRTGRGAGAVQRELKLLTDCGILRRDRQRFYQANSASPIYGPLKEIVIRTVGLGERLRNVLNRVAGHIVIALIFGSFARGEQHERSDVDVLVITRDDQLTADQVNALLGGEQDQLGREINPFVLTTREWRQKWKSGSPFVHRIVDSEKIYLIGNDHELNRLAKKRMAQAPQTHPAGDHRSSRTGGSRP